MKRLFTFIMMAALLGGSLMAAGQQDSSTGGKDEILIGAVFADLGNTAYVNMGAAMEEEAAKYNGKLILKETGNDAGTLVDTIENFIVAGCDIIIEQNSDQKITETINQQVKDAGIILVSFDAEMSQADISYLADNYDLGFMIGSMAGNWISEALNGQADFGLLTARDYDFILDRQQGIEDGLAKTAPNANIVISADAVSVVDGMSVTESFLQAYPDLNGIVGINDSVVLGAYEAFKSSGKISDSIGLFACDGTKEGLSAVAEGSIHRGTVSLHLNEVGRMMVRDSIDLLEGKTLDSKIKYFPLEQVTIKNVGDFL